MNSENPAPRDPKRAETFPHLVRDAAIAYGDAVAIALEGETIPDESLTFAELDRESAKLARGLIARGVGKGSRVGFIYGNGPSFALMFAAIARVGAIAIPVSTLLKSDDLVRVLRQSDVAGLLVQRQLLGKDYVQRLCEALPELAETGGQTLRLPRVPFLRWIVSSGESLPLAIHPLSWLTDAAGDVSESLLEEVESEVHPADQIMEIYTSGSMALPKGVKHNHGPVMFRTHYIRSKLDLKAGQPVAAPMPMFWVGGLMMYLLPNWECGAVTCCRESTKTNSRFAMGSVLTDEDADQLYGEGIIWSLGMTETLGPYSWADQARVPGFPLSPPLDHIADGFEVRVVNDEGCAAEEGETGEIRVRGYPLTPGLHKIERSGHFTEDGFYCTGDLGVVQGERILFVGRNGDMIKTAGTNVSPAEVEMALQEIDGIDSAYVVGIPDRERGQLVVAAVVPRKDAILSFETIDQHLRRKLSSYKVPRQYVVISRDDVPMLPSNKVARRQIENLVEDRLKQCVQ